MKTTTALNFSFDDGRATCYVRLTFFTERTNGDDCATVTYMSCFPHYPAVLHTTERFSIELFEQATRVAYGHLANLQRRLAEHLGA